MKNKVHIVCLDAPAPPDYGGAIDMYYKIIALAAAGADITLHYFNYHPQRSIAALQPYCTDVFAYQRLPAYKALTFSKPYIVASRINQQLVSRLNEDDAPVILEGIHSTGIIPFLKNKCRKIIVRVHNDEAVYYNRLAQAESNFLKKAYFKIESALLQKYQRNLPPHVDYACLSTLDITQFEKLYGCKNVYFLPCFTAWQNVSGSAGNGTYCLYHGNLSVVENEAAALWLIEKVFSKTDTKLVIAGKGISKKIAARAQLHKNIELRNNPTIKDIQQLICEAHINVLPSVNSTGVKLKLLHALFEGRFCITNKAGVMGSHINESVFIAEEPSEYILLIKQLMEQPFTTTHIQQREALQLIYNNNANAQKLIAHLW